MLELESARDKILSAVPPVVVRTIPLTESDGRVLAANVRATIDLPTFDNSSMDGFAVRSEDVSRACQDSPVELRLTGQVAAGDEASSITVPTGNCVRVFTGSSLPAGADAVIVQEDAQPLSNGSARVRFFDRAAPGENVRRRGEDIKQGAVVLAVGETLKPASLALLAALGIGEVQVSERPVVALLATGNELIEPGRGLRLGQVYETNRPALIPLATRAGAIPRAYPPVGDRLDDTRIALEKAFAECDVVVTSGGVSVGETDLVKSAFETLGGTLEFWKVAIKPGKPFVFGRFGRKLLFGLPGNPVSAIVTFLLLVHPALRRMQGAIETGPPSLPATLDEPLANPGDRRHFIRVTVDARGEVRSAGEQGSHRLMSMARANGLVDVPPNTTLPIGSQVSVLRLD